MKCLTENNLVTEVLVSIVVVARNEEENILFLLNSIAEQSYSKSQFELIVVDDCSDDKTVKIVEDFKEKAQFRINVCSLCKKPSEEQNKKSGIIHAIKQARGDWILCTDADCILPRDWISTFIKYKELKNVRLIIGPVQILDTSSFLSRFQAIDFIAMQSFTAYSASRNQAMLCNGANLAYEKKLFEELNPYDNDVISGDDMFLLHEVQKKYPEAIAYLKDKGAIVKTRACNNLSEFINQRVRWGGKVKTFNHYLTVLVITLLFLCNLSMIACLALSTFYSLFLLVFAVFFIVKSLFELWFMIPIMKFFRQSHLLSLFLTAQIIHIFYMFIVGILANILPYRWKGRVRKI